MLSEHVNFTSYWRSWRQQWEKLRHLAVTQCATLAHPWSRWCHKDRFHLKLKILYYILFSSVILAFINLGTSAKSGDICRHVYDSIIQLTPNLLYYLAMDEFVSYNLCMKLVRVSNMFQKHIFRGSYLGFYRSGIVCWGDQGTRLRQLIDQNILLQTH